MWRRVDIVWTDVSEERIAPIFRIFNKNPRARNQREQVAADGIVQGSEPLGFTQNLEWLRKCKTLEKEPASCAVQWIGCLLDIL
jgi:hypothetical protein